MPVNCLIEMDEREYLLMRSVHAKIDDVITEQNLNPDQIWVARQSAFDGATVPNDVIEDDDEESGIFCMSNVSVFQKTDPTVSLSYWIGQLLSQKMLAGKMSLFTAGVGNYFRSRATFRHFLCLAGHIVIKKAPFKLKKCFLRVKCCPLLVYILL